LEKTVGEMADRTALHEQLLEEQGAFADLLRGLGPLTWSTPSLCEGWTVRETVTHTAWHIHLSPVEVLKSVPDTIRTRGNIAMFNSRLWDRYAKIPTEGLIEWLASPAIVNHNNLGELIVHQQGIRRPLGLMRRIAPAPLLSTLSYSLTPVGGGYRGLGTSSYKLGRGLSFTATDMAWSFGSGARVQGPGGAILMAINGRSQAVADLDGDGVDLLARPIASLSPSKYMVLSPRVR